MQGEVVAPVPEPGTHPEEEVLIKEGYAIDAFVLWEGGVVAVMIDGPGLFVGDAGRSAPGATLPKRRYPCA